MTGTYAQHQVPTRHVYVTWVLFIFTYLYLYLYYRWELDHFMSHATSFWFEFSNLKVGTMSSKWNFKKGDTSPELVEGGKKKLNFFLTKFNSNFKFFFSVYFFFYQTKLSRLSSFDDYFVVVSFFFFFYFYFWISQKG